MCECAEFMNLKLDVLSLRRNIALETKDAFRNYINEFKVHYRVLHYSKSIYIGTGTVTLFLELSA